MKKASKQRNSECQNAVTVSGHEQSINKA